MSLARKILDIFCNSGTSDIGIFGSKYNGSSDVSSDPDDIQRGQGGNNTNWAEGWARAIVTNQAPCLEDMNGVMYVLSYMTKYLYQNGLAEWDASEGYGLYAMTQYGGSLYMSIQTDPLYDNLNLNHNPSSSPTWWKKMLFTSSWVAGQSYNVGDSVNYNGKTYKCIRNHTASSLFETDYNGKVLTSSPLTYQCGNWDDGNPAGTIVRSISFNKPSGRDANGDDPLPYHYFDVTGADAGREISQSTYSALYEVIGGSYNTAFNFVTNTTYPAVASGNFRLPDFRNTFFKNAGTNTKAQGHNARHTHAHNRNTAINFNHSHAFQGGSIPMCPSSPGNYLAYTSGSPSSVTAVWTVPVGSGATTITQTSTTTLGTVSALIIDYQGSQSYPEPNYYGTRILLKY